MDKLAIIPMITYVLGCISVVIGAFLIGNIIGFLALGCALLVTSFILSGELDEVNEVIDKGEIE